MKMDGVIQFDRDVVQAPMGCQRLVAIVLVAALALTSSLTVAQVALPTVEQTIAPEVIQIGDPVTVVITVTHDPDTEVVLPEPLDLAPFEVLGEVRLSEEVDEQLSRSRLELAATAACASAATTGALFLSKFHDIFLRALFRFLGEADLLFSNTSQDDGAFDAFKCFANGVFVAIDQRDLFIILTGYHR